MGAVVVRPQREAAAAHFLVAAALALLALGMLAGGGATLIAGAAAGVLLLAAVAVRRPFIPWEGVLGLLVLVILFIPLRRYTLPGDAGFGLEPYRLLVALILAGWGAALLADRRVQLRRTGLELPLACVVLAVLASILANPARVGELQSTVLKAVTFLVSFMIVIYLVVSVVRRQEAADAVVKTLVAGGAVVALLAVIETRTGVTPFTQLSSIFPFLIENPNSFGTEISRGSRIRAMGSAEHPIALSAALVMLVPLAIYLVKTRGNLWYLAVGALVLGAVSAVSRTGVLMLVVVGLVFLWLRGRETRRIAPVILPIFVATHFLVPGTLGALKGAFFPEGGVIAEQQGKEGNCKSSGRVADLGPTLDEVAKKPFFGYGYGTRITTGENPNACILDNEWLGTLHEAGIGGFLAWMLLFLGVVRRFGRMAKDDGSPAGWLVAAVTASVAAFAVGMFTFDAFGFSQVTVLLFILLGLGSAAMANARPRRLTAV